MNTKTNKTLSAIKYNKLKDYCPLAILLKPLYLKQRVQIK